MAAVACHCCQGWLPLVVDPDVYPVDDDDDDDAQHVSGNKANKLVHVGTVCFAKLKNFHRI